MRILLATSLHEHLAALPGFHLNWQAALSGRMMTLAHLSATTRPQMLLDAAEQGVLPSVEGLLINPTSIATRFGSALPMLIHNHQTASRLGLQASHICLASPYLYALQPGLDEVIAAADCGLHGALYDMHAHWYWHDQAQADTRLTDLARYLGVPIRIGRADGVFMTTALFEALLAVLHKFYQPTELAQPAPLYPLEEILFPTVLPALLGGAARIVETRARVWEQNTPPSHAGMVAAIQSHLYASAKRVPQERGHPVRRAVLANLPGEAALMTKLGTTIA